MRTPLYTPPPLGVGMAWAPALSSHLSRNGWPAGLRLDVLEVDTGHLWQPAVSGAAGGAQAIGGPHGLRPGPFAELATTAGACVLHVSGLPLTHAGELCAQQQQPWQATVERLQPTWVSAPLAFSRAADLRADGAAAQAGILLPPLPCAATVLTAVRRISQLRKLSGCPVAFRVVANPLRPVAGEMHDGDFYAAVAEAAGCGIVVDLQALRVGERAGRPTVREVLARLPLHRVWGLRLGGGPQAAQASHSVQAAGGTAATAPSGAGNLVAPADAALLAEWLPALTSLGAVIVDSAPERWRAQGLDATALAAQIGSLQARWADRLRVTAALEASHRRSVFGALARPGLSAGAATGAGVAAAASAAAAPGARDVPATGPMCSVTAWERALVCLVNQRELPRGSRSLEALQADPGLPLLQQQLMVSRSHRLLKCLPLSWRALVLKLGQPAAEALRAAFWRQQWPEATALAEAACFAAFLHRALAAGQVQVPHLGSVLDYEMACAGAGAGAAADAATGAAKRQVHFDCEPTLLLSALARGEWPAERPLAAPPARPALRAAA